MLQGAARRRKLAARTFAADAARALPHAVVPAGPHRRDEAVEETHHVLRRAQSGGVLHTQSRENKPKLTK